VVTGNVKFPEVVIVPALKPPLASLDTIAFAVFEEVAVLPSVTAPVAPETLIPPPPVREVTLLPPAAWSVRLPPSATVPPPVSPLPVLMVTDGLASWVLAIKPVILAAATLFAVASVNTCHWLLPMYCRAAVVPEVPASGLEVLVPWEV
jgi:hypothetical protein